MSSKSRIVVKLGTQVVVDPDNGGPALDRLQPIIDDIAALRKDGNEVILVSSGAVGLGRQVCHLQGPLDLPEKQACAAVGQSRLMALYERLCTPYNITVAQILVTARDFANRQSYLHLRGSCEALLQLEALPIFNENDVTSVAGIQEREASSGSSMQKSFDDNDKLSALVAAKLNADQLIIITNVEGVYSENPTSNPQAPLIKRIESLEQLGAVACSGNSALGRGGMSSKLEAAKIAGVCGVTTIITSATGESPIRRAREGARGTTVSFSHLVPGHLPGRKRWIGLSSGYAGIVTVDARAREALEETSCSLLPVGVINVEGDFDVGEIISVVDINGEEIGRGISSQRAASLRRIAGQKSDVARAALSSGEKTEVIHRDNLVIFTDTHHGA